MGNFIGPPNFYARMRRLYGDQADALLAGDGLPARGLRVNTLKCPVERFGELWDGEAKPVPFCEEGFQVNPYFKAGADPLHHAGAYYMQEPSAMSAVTVLAPLTGERILDLCAAPGGKSTQIAAALRGQGLLWCNEYVRGRARVLAQNIERCGVRNAVVSSADAALLAGRLEGFFDGVLVDAPCSGEGMFRKEPAALEQWSEDNIRLCAARGRDILDAAAAMVRTGGRLVYSTCTFAPEENECQIAAFLNRHPEFELTAIEAPFGRPGLPWERVEAFAQGIEEPAADLTLCRRITPADGGEGHFIARLVRRGEAKVTVALSDQPIDSRASSAEELYQTCFWEEPTGVWITHGEQIRLLPAGLPEWRGLGVLEAGIAVANVCKNRLEPCHAAFMAAQAAGCRRLVDLKRGDERLGLFLKGQEIPVEDVQGWTAVAVEGITLGFGKAGGGRLKNRYPKGLRLLG